MSGGNVQPGDRVATATTASLGAVERGDALAVEHEQAALPGLDRYRDLGLIGAGGMGEVRRVHDRLMGRVLAMKILSWRLAGDPAARHSFLHEARITSTLQHPGIVAVHDVGVLPDGRPWYTMREVRGQTFGAMAQALRAGAADLSDSGLVIMVQLLMRACEAVAFAHSRGVIHCDLKPANLMVGRFGEVQVMDWGVAVQTQEPPSSISPLPLPLHALASDDPSDDALLEQLASPSGSGRYLTRRAKLAGTLAYMAPEQARGAEQVAASDVYSLGAVLYETMAGRAPFVGSARKILIDLLAGPPPPLASFSPDPRRRAALCAICERAMSRSLTERYADMAELVHALRQWLDRRQRDERAAAILKQADQTWPVMAAERERARRLRAEAGRQLQGVQPYDPIDTKLPAWRLQEQASACERKAAEREVDWQQTVRSALNEVPECEAAHQRLADYYRLRLEAAEASGDAEGAARSEALLRVHDRGRHAAYLRGDGALTLLTDPPGARLTAYRYAMIDRQLVPELIGDIGPSPIVEQQLSCGSYLIIASAADHAELRYPVHLTRDGSWTAVRPNDDAPTALWLPPVGQLADDDIVVPAGWFRCGGDPAAIEPLPARRVWVDSFVIRRHPVTCGEYLRYLNALVAAGRAHEAANRAPKRPLFRGQEEPAEPLWSTDRQGRYQLDPACSDPDQARWPVSLIDWYDSCAYARWVADTSGQRWRLPSEVEWEKAARGVDGRFLPWGDYFEPTRACVMDSHNGELGPKAVELFPADESPYGVRGMAGNVREWCIERWERNGPELSSEILQVCAAAAADPDYRVVRGGAWTSVVERSQLASRFAVKPSDRFRGLGFRLVRAVTPR